MMHYDPERITFFGKTDARGRHVTFGIKAKDRTRHVYVIGKTGMGKSTLLENMAVQDIQNGEGLAFIDPHGQTAETLLEYIPEERKDDVLYFAPFDMEHPVSFNVMEDVGPDKRHLVVSGLMSTFKKIWVDAWSARMEYILSNTLLALLEYPDSTLLGVNRMLSDKLYREKVVANIKDPAVKSFWVDEFAKYNERYMQEAGDAIKNKIGQFTSNPLIRNIIGQPKSSFNVRKIMDEQKILIMNLSKGLIGESNANLLGSMLITRIYLSAMSRADLSVQQLNAMPNFYFYVDEFQSFANETFANILSEARKYKLNLTIAHQYIEQMEEEVKNAVFGNVGTMIAFRVGPFDAEVLETIFQPKFMATDICNLGFAQIYLTLMIDGIGSPPFSAVTLPPITPPSLSCKHMVIASSRKQFTRQRIEVEQIIDRFHEPVTPLEKESASGTRSPKDQKHAKNNRDRTQQGTQSNRNHTGGADRQRPQHGGGATKQGGRSNEQTQKRGAPPVQASGKNMDELRATLRSIVGGENKEGDGGERVSGSSKKSETRVHTSKETHSGSKEGGAKDLKETLARVIEGAGQTPTAKQPANTSRDEAVQNDTHKSTPPPGVSHRRDASGSQNVSGAHTNAPQPNPRERNDVSPKELERMMRITTSDRPPL